MIALWVMLLSVGVFLGSLYITGWHYRYALAHELLDLPNARSAHVAATPRGGGIAFVLSMLLALPVLCVIGAEAPREVCALLTGGGIAAFTGFADDRRNVALYWRLLGQFAAAVMVLVCLGGTAQLPILASAQSLWLVRNGFAIVYLVWLLNLTNFMDGIDGIASVETITVSLGGAFLYWIVAPEAYSWAAPLLLAAAVMGFLVWNWPPAKIFMGDTGSGFLGIILGTFSLQAARVAPTLFWSWLILLGVFVVDATVTLCWRTVWRERIFEAHSSHAYQFAARRWGHRAVTIATGAINLVWLLPIAALVARGSFSGVQGVTIAYAPILYAVFWLKLHQSRDR